MAAATRAFEHSDLADQLEAVRTAFDRSPLFLRREVMRAALSEVRGSDVDDLPQPLEPLHSAVHEAAPVEDRDSLVPNSAPELQNPASESEPVRPGGGTWYRVAVVWLVERLLVDPALEAVGNIPSELVLYLWLAAIAQAPSPPATPTLLRPDAPNPPVQILEEFDAERRVAGEALVVRENQRK